MDQMTQAAKKPAAAKDSFDIGDDEIDPEDEDPNTRSWGTVMIFKFSASGQKPLRVFNDMKPDEVKSKLKVGGKPVTEGDSQVGMDPKGHGMMAVVYEVGGRPTLVALYADMKLPAADVIDILNDLEGVY